MTRLASNVEPATKARPNALLHINPNTDDPIPLSVAPKNCDADVEQDNHSRAYRQKDMRGDRLDGADAPSPRADQTPDCPKRAAQIANDTANDTAHHLAQELAAAAALKAMLADDPLLADDAVLWGDMLEGETNLMGALDAMLLADLDDESLLLGLNQARDEINARTERIKSRKARRRALIEHALMTLDLKRIERPLATLSLAARPPSLTIDDEAAIPTCFFIAKPSLDRAGLKAALTAGEVVMGARLEAGVVSLTVRRR